MPPYYLRFHSSYNTEKRELTFLHLPAPVSFYHACPLEIKSEPDLETNGTFIAEIIDAHLVIN